MSATGRDRADWFAVLDDWGAPNRSYRAIADWLTTEHGVSAWWAQKLIVEYEQDRDIRQPGARPDGTFAGGASKTLAAPVDRVVEAFTDATLRGRWLTDLELSERSQPGRSIRFDVADGSRVSIVLEDKGNKTPSGSWRTACSRSWSAPAAGRSTALRASRGRGPASATTATMGSCGRP